MYNKKYGFTLAEVLIALVVVGAIVAMSVTVVMSVQGAYTKATYYVFKNLEAAVTQIMSGAPTGAFNASDIKLPEGAVLDPFESDSGSPETNADGDKYLYNTFEYKDITRTRNLLFTCKTANNQNLTLLRGVDIDKSVEYSEYIEPENETDETENSYSCSEYQTSSDNQSNWFCYALAGLSNTGKKSKNAINCDVNNLMPIDNPQSKEPRINKGALDSVYSSFKKNSTGGMRPNFITTNGYLYFVSKWAKMNDSDEYGYRLVAVDVNGTRKPNVSTPERARIPDIVTFIVWDTGVVLPLGVAADDYFNSDRTRRARYLPSLAKGYNYSNYSGSGSVIPKECSDNGNRAPSGCSYAVTSIDKNNDPLYKMTYREAYCAAFASRRNIMLYPDDFMSEYCDGHAQDSSCPGVGNGFDACMAEPVKPAFKFNLD